MDSLVRNPKRDSTNVVLNPLSSPMHLPPDPSSLHRASSSAERGEGGATPTPHAPYHRAGFGERISVALLPPAGTTGVSPDPVDPAGTPFRQPRNGVLCLDFLSFTINGSKELGALWENVLTFAVICIGAYLGCFIRIGFQYYKSTASQMSFTVMYAQIVGCFIMGIASEFQKQLMAGTRLQRLFYVFVTTGLCGSITTFSTWHFEANKLFVLQGDTSWGNVGFSYNGGRLLDYCVQLWIGFVLPLAALNGGQHLVQAIKDAPPATTPPPPSSSAKVTPTIRAAVGGDHPSSSIASRVASMLSPLTRLGGRSSPTIASSSESQSPQQMQMQQLPRPTTSASKEATHAELSGADDALASSNQPAAAGVPPPPTAAATTTAAAAAVVTPPGRPGPVLLFGVDFSRPDIEVAAECGILLLWLVSGLLVTILPVSTGWTFLAFCAGLGAFGAYLRFWFAPLNKGLPAHFPGRTLWAKLGLADGAFPWGTFIVNMGGTWLLAVIMVLAKFVVSYHDHLSLALLYGVGTGFCGCLTTMSTFVLELHRLPRRAGYIYGVASFFVAQVGWGIIFDAYAMQAGRAAANLAVDAPTMAFCPNFVSVCNSLLTHVNCSAVARTSQGCTDGTSMATWVGVCACGTFDASVRVQELLIDSQARLNVTGSLVAVWPTAGDGGGGVEPETAIDMCISFQNLCDHTLQRINCPAPLRVNNPCGRLGISNFLGICECGLMLQGDTRVAELIIDALAYRRYDMLPYGGYLSAPVPASFCAIYEDVCRKHLNHVQCPPSARTVYSCDVPGDLTTFNGVCACGINYDPLPSGRLSEVIMDSMIKPNWWPRMVRLSPAAAATAGGAVVSVAQYDACGSFDALCGYFMEIFGCPAAAQTVQGCALPTGVPPRPFVLDTDWTGLCMCGTLDASGRMGEYVFDGILSYAMVPYQYIPPPIAPFNLLVGSNPFRPLLTPASIIPGFNTP